MHGNALQVSNINMGEFHAELIDSVTFLKFI